MLGSAQLFATNSITFAKGQYVSVGSGCIGISKDGITWSRINTGTGEISTSITFGNGEFVALTQGGFNALHTADGIAVTTKSPIGLINPTMYTAGTSVPNGIRFLNGQFLAVDNQGRLVTSSDAITWTEHIIPGLSVNGQLTAVTYGNGRYVVVGMNGIIASSTDTITWTTSSSISTSRYFFDVAFLNGKFFAVGQGGMTYTSTDGITWASLTVSALNYNTSATAFGSSQNHAPAEFRSITYGNGMYVIAGMNYSLNSVMGAGNSFFSSILTSPDGINWTERNDAPEGIRNISSMTGLPFPSRVIFADGKFIMLSRSGGASNTGAVFSSIDGIHWADRTPAGVTGLGFEDVAFGNGKLILVGGSGLGTLLMTSP